MKYDFEIIIGVDCGLDGAIAALRLKDRALFILDMPTRKKAGGKREVDPKAVADELAAFNRLRSFALVEKVDVMKPSDSPIAMFSFGRSFGVILGALHAMVNASVIETTPNVWKPMLGLSTSKSDSVNMARKVFPAHARHFVGSKDGRAEAALLCHLGSKFFKELQNDHT